MKELSKYKKRILLTGGCGFIGSHVVRHFVNKYPEYLIINFDALTYCGNMENLQDVQDKDNYEFIHGDIFKEAVKLRQTFETYDITDIIHMAAESHVDRSMTNPNIFMETNVNGTVNLLNFSKEYWGQKGDSWENHRFFNMCTDEIFGTLQKDDVPFNEHTPLDPHSPYATSKTGQYLYGKTYYEAYGVPVISLACGNAIGPNQFPEKLVPLTIDRIINRQEIPVYGKGEQMRDWTNVHDICDAIDLIFHHGTIGELYCIGGDACMQNIEIIHALIEQYTLKTTPNILPLNEKANKKCMATRDELEKLIKFIPDPRGKSHDFRYDLDHSKITRELGWRPKHTFNDSINEVIEWYLLNKEWVEHCKSGEYQKWIETYYKE
jgi:dTDP-glucose 4,6-dehydratase